MAENTVFVRCVCACVCARVCLCAADRSISPVWTLNVYSSKTVKATDFDKFDVHVPRDSSGQDPLKFVEKGASLGSRDSLNIWALNDPLKFFYKNSLGGGMHPHERLLVC